jgi:ribosomal protein L35
MILQKHNVTEQATSKRFKFCGEGQIAHGATMFGAGIENIER